MTDDEPNIVTGAPDRIWLVVGDGIVDEVPFSELAEVSWCADRIGDQDIEYVRARKLKDDEIMELWRKAFPKAFRWQTDTADVIAFARALLGGGK